MKWFKFYGGEYLCDPKMLSLSASKRSCWITLLSYGSINDNGMITHLEEEQLMIQSGVSPLHEEWDETKGVLEVFVKLEMIRIDNGMITILNWNKRQEMNLTGYQRVKRWREKKRLDNANDNEEITIEENRRDKKRIEKKKEDTPPSAVSIISWTKEILIWLEAKRGVKFADYGKQLSALGRMKKANYTPNQIKEAMGIMEKDDWWATKNPDFVNLASNIHKLIKKEDDQWKFKKSIQK